MKRPRGRPRLDPTDRSVDLHFRIPAKHYDAAYAQAASARCTVPELIRRTLGRGANRIKRDTK